MDLKRYKRARLVSANCDPQAKSGPLPVYVSKVLLELLKNKIQLNKFEDLIDFIK